MDRKDRSGQRLEVGTRSRTHSSGCTPLSQQVSLTASAGECPFRVCWSLRGEASAVRVLELAVWSSPQTDSQPLLLLFYSVFCDLAP